MSSESNVGFLKGVFATIATIAALFAIYEFFIKNQIAPPPNVQPTTVVQQIPQQPTSAPVAGQPTVISIPATQIPQQPTNVPVASQPTTTSIPTSAPPPPTATQIPFVTTFQVFANLSWQDAGVQIKSGDRLRIIWDGKSRWRGVNFGDFGDPLGGYIDPNPNYACPPLAPSNEVGWNALVAKIGANGVPTNPFKAIPNGEGGLYLAMNDCDKERYDNEGSIIVTIEVRH